LEVTFSWGESVGLAWAGLGGLPLLGKSSDKKIGVSKNNMRINKSSIK